MPFVDATNTWGMLRGQVIQLPAWTPGAVYYWDSSDTGAFRDAIAAAELAAGRAGDPYVEMYARDGTLCATYQPAAIAAAGPKA